jgi:hypothetical protein
MTFGMMTFGMMTGQHAGIQHDDIKHGAIQHDGIQHVGIQHGAIQHAGIQQNDTKALATCLFWPNYDLPHKTIWQHGLYFLPIYDLLVFCWGNQQIYTGDSTLKIHFQLVKLHLYSYDFSGRLHRPGGYQ